LRSTVVSDDIGPNLVFGEMLNAYGRDLADTSQLGCSDATMTGDDSLSLVDDDWICPAVGLDARCDLGDLALGVSSSILRMLNEILYPLIDDLKPSSGAHEGSS